MNEIDIVRRFLAAMEDLDLDRAFEYVDNEIVYQNNNLPPARGRQAFERQLRTMDRFGDYFQARMHHIAQDGACVLTHRTDVLGVKGARFEFWVFGVFEVRDAKIVDWHDYFDWAQVTGRSLRTLPRIAVNTIVWRRGPSGQK